MLPAGVRIYVYTEPVDMRKSFDGLALITKQSLGRNPQGGDLYCFINKRKNRTKILWWDDNGYCLLYKRLSGSLFVSPRGNSDDSSVRIDGNQLAALLKGVLRKEKRRGLLTSDPN